MFGRVTVLVVCLASALAGAATVSAIAAASMELPVFSGTAATRSVGSTGSALFATGGASDLLECETSSDEFAFDSGKRAEGPGTLDFSGCRAEDEYCRSLGDATGSVLMTGTWHLVLMVKGGKDGHYLLFVLPASELHVECPLSANGLLLFSGEFLGSIAQNAGSSTEFGITVKDNGNEQEFTEYENDAGTGLTASVQVTFDGHKPKEVLLEIKQDSLDFNGATSIEK